MVNGRMRSGGRLELPWAQSFRVVTLTLQPLSRKERN